MKQGRLTPRCRKCYYEFYVKPFQKPPSDSMKRIRRTIMAQTVTQTVGLRQRVKELLARTGFRTPEYVACRLGISVEAARALMFDGSGDDPTK